jgi:hypothetical protein
MFSLLKKLNNIFFNNEKNIKKIVDDFNQIKTRKIKYLLQKLLFIHYYIPK